MDTKKQCLVVFCGWVMFVGLGGCERKPRATEPPCSGGQQLVQGQCVDPNAAGVPTTPNNLKPNNDPGLKAPGKPEPGKGEARQECSAVGGKSGVSPRALYLKCLFDGKTAQECDADRSCTVTLTAQECREELQQHKTSYPGQSTTWTCPAS